MKIISNKKWITLFILSVVLPLRGFFSYHDQLKPLSKESQVLYTYWLSSEWSPLMYASSMYQWGGLLGIIIGLLVWNSQTSTLKHHTRNFAQLIGGALMSVVIGVITWYCLAMTYYRYTVYDHTDLSILIHDLLAFLAVTQYVLFWAIMTYGITYVFRRRIFSFALLVGIQLVELFWILIHLQSLELVLPTAISRVPVALAYPVWRTDSWATTHPSLIGSSPMTFTSTFAIRDVHLSWVFLVEAIYVGIAVCCILLDLTRRKKHELVHSS